MMSFNMAWRWCLGVLLLHERPWRPLASTSFPRTQLWGEQAPIPSLIATEVPTSSSVSLNPREAVGCMWSPDHHREESKLLRVWRRRHRLQLKRWMCRGLSSRYRRSRLLGFFDELHECHSGQGNEDLLHHTASTGFWYHQPRVCKTIIIRSVSLQDYDDDYYYY